MPDNIDILFFEPFFSDRAKTVAAKLDSGDNEITLVIVADELIERIEGTRSAVILCNLESDATPGFELLSRIGQVTDDPTIIGLTSRLSSSLLIRAAMAGAWTLIEYSAGIEVLQKAIVEATELERQRAPLRRQRLEAKRRLALLDDEEWHSFHLVMAGQPQKAIARQADVSLRTVERQCASILKKLGVRTQIEAACLYSLAQAGTLSCDPVSPHSSQALGGRSSNGVIPRSDVTH